MYIRLTSRCNMTCAHCAFSCTSHGQDMTRETYKAALKLSTDYGSYITLGGGEPTMHPLFWEFLGLALATSDVEGLYIVTNGKITDIAIALAKLARAGILGAALSQDEYHDRIDPEVIAAFTKDKWANTIYGYVPRTDSDSRDNRSISSPNSIINAGRAKKNGFGNLDECFCDDLLVEPDGRLWWCGCRKVALGTISEPQIPQSYWDEPGVCSRKRA